MHNSGDGTVHQTHDQPQPWSLQEGSRYGDRVQSQEKLKILLEVSECPTKEHNQPHPCPI